jgi:spore germination cell wall hydrolase CwlJ-like protein
VVILSRGILGIALLVACALGTHPALAQARLATAGERTDERCLADNIYFEAAHEPLDGKLAVAQVTLNRARDAGVSVCNAVYFKAINPRTGKKEAAFSWTLGARWRPKGMDPLLHAWCAELAHEALAGLRALPLPDDVRFYHATYVRPRWANQHEMVTRIGRHIFYR